MACHGWHQKNCTKVCCRDSFETSIQCLESKLYALLISWIKQFEWRLIANKTISARKGIRTQFDLRRNDGQPACKKVFDAEDSFPTGAIRKTGRLFCRPDLINVQKLDGILYDVKYLIIARNVTVSIIRFYFFFVKMRSSYLAWTKSRLYAYSPKMQR